MLEKQLSYKERVYKEIKNGILTGQYPPGSVMNERKLSAELGISRTPIREALQMLARDGWLQMEIYKGAVVREFDPHSMWELTRVRCALELSAIEDAVRNLTDADLLKLRQIQEKQQALLSHYNPDEFISLDRAFHSYIYQLSHNKELIKLVSNYYDMFRFLGMQALGKTEQRRATTIAEHLAILEAMERRDPEGAIQAMKAHMDETANNIRSNIGLEP